MSVSGKVTPRRKQWSEAQAATLRMMLEQGKSFKEIAEVVGRTPDSVDRYIRRNKLPVPKVAKPKSYENPLLIQMYAEGRAYQDIADALSAPLGSIAKWVSEALAAGLITRRTKGWDEAKKQKLVELAAQGLGIHAISRRTGWPTSSIYANGKRLGIQFPKYVQPKSNMAAARAAQKAERARLAAERAARAEEDRRLKAEVAARLWGKTEGARPFLERESGECRWPLGERGNYFACCKPTGADQSYCRAHRLMAGGYKRPQVAGFKMVRPYVEQEARVAA